jgi:lipid-binding SYLF domain-containing protein
VKPGIDLTLEVEGKEIMMKQGVPKTALSVGILAIMRGFAVSVMILAISAVTPKASLAQRASEINRSATQALNTLYKNNPNARNLGDKAVGILIFPSIVKGGFIIAGQFGDGVLRKGGKPVAYYRSLAASYGFQAGAQAFGYVLFFMDNASIQYLDKSGGWELGTGPSLVVLDSGFGRNLSTTTLQKGVYALIFNQKGLMGGTGIQGTKITRINPS